MSNRHDCVEIESLELTDVIKFFLSIFLLLFSSVYKFRCSEWTLQKITLYKQIAPRKRLAKWASGAKDKNLGREGKNLEDEVTKRKETRVRWRTRLIQGEETFMLWRQQWE